MRSWSHRVLFHIQFKRWEKHGSFVALFWCKYFINRDFFGAAFLYFFHLISISVNKVSVHPHGICVCILCPYNPVSMTTGFSSVRPGNGMICELRVNSHALAPKPSFAALFSFTHHTLNHTSKPQRKQMFQFRALFSLHILAVLFNIMLLISP